MKIKQILQSVLMTVFMVGAILTIPTPAMADCGGIKTNIINCDQGGGGNFKDNGIWGLLLLIINILTAGVGIVAVGGIVYGSILYTSASSNADKTKKAINIIVNVVIGIVAWVLSYSFLNFIIPGGIF